jgi:hypothetical protein
LKSDREKIALLEKMLADEKKKWNVYVEISL